VARASAGLVATTGATGIAAAGAGATTGAALTGATTAEANGFWYSVSALITCTAEGW
jgi:hypothetical protein